MHRRDFTLRAIGLGAAAWLSPSAWAGVSQADATAGVRLALERGADAAVDLLGRTDGFLGNPKVRIPLPGVLNDAAKLLKATGQQKRVDELVTAMNRAAEAAVPEARSLLVNAAKSMSVEDALAIVRGGQTSVTDYFARKTREPLSVKFLPIVARETEKVSLAQKYDAVAGKAAGFGLLKKEDANLNGYVTGKALNGLFLIIGEEEKKLRQNPLGAGSDLLKKVFGG
jgi:Protein of unknown function (DUF4197)